MCIDIEEVCALLVVVVVGEEEGIERGSCLLVMYFRQLNIGKKERNQHLSIYIERERERERGSCNCHTFNFVTNPFFCFAKPQPSLFSRRGIHQDGTSTMSSTICSTRSCKYLLQHGLVIFSHDHHQCIELPCHVHNNIAHQVTCSTMEVEAMCIADGDDVCNGGMA